MVPQERLKLPAGRGGSEFQKQGRRSRLKSRLRKAPGFSPDAKCEYTAKYCLYNGKRRRRLDKGSIFADSIEDATVSAKIESPPTHC